jgi:hypothetical protein
MGETPLKIAVLESEVQARLLGAILADRGIPHIIQSYYSLAYDGVFQLGRGWGHVEAPPRFRAEILGILKSMRRGPVSSDDEPEDRET